MFNNKLQLTLKKIIYVYIYKLYKKILQFYKFYIL